MNERGHVSSNGPSCSLFWRNAYCSPPQDIRKAVLPCASFHGLVAPTVFATRMSYRSDCISVRVSILMQWTPSAFVFHTSVLSSSFLCLVSMNVLLAPSAAEKTLRYNPLFTSQLLVVHSTTISILSYRPWYWYIGYVGCVVVSHVPLSPSPQSPVPLGTGDWGI